MSYSLYFRAGEQILEKYVIVVSIQDGFPQCFYMLLHLIHRRWRDYRLRRQMRRKSRQMEERLELNNIYLAQTDKMGAVDLL